MAEELVFELRLEAARRHGDVRQRALAEVHEQAVAPVRADREVGREGVEGRVEEVAEARRGEAGRGEVLGYDAQEEVRVRRWWGSRRRG